MDSVFDEMSADIAHQLDGVNRYNPENVELLEKYIDVQLAENEYDLEANLTVLKLYQLNPEKYNSEVVAKVFLKSIMQLPRSDLSLAKSLLDHAKTDEENVKYMMEFAEKVEMCQFEKVWKEIRENSKIFEAANGFEESIRNFVCHTVQLSYQNIHRDTLNVQFGNLSDGDFARICKNYDWTIESDGYVHIANMEATVKNRNIAESIDIQSVQDVLRQNA